MDFLQRLGRFLDRPQFPWKKIIVGFSLAQYIFEGYLSLRQYKVLQQTKPPKALSGEVTQDVFDKSQAYGRAKSRFGLVSSLYGQIQNYSIIYYDVLPRLWALTGFWLVRYFPAAYTGEIMHTLIFFFTFNFITSTLNLPISFYSTFVLEEKFGFNKQTLKLWITDMLKEQALMVAFGAPLLSGFLAIIQKTGNSFFYYLWLFSIGVQICAITVYPILILPFFNKLSPLQEGQLKTSVESLARRLQFPLKELYVIDGSKRSAHSNAYFYGLPWKKHIVIYDTLIEKSETEEVVAVLSHELGHWSLGHTTKLFGIAQLHMFYIFALFSVFINNRSLYQSFGFHKEFPIIIGFILFSDALTPMDTIVKLLMNILSRTFEFQADEFAVKLGYPKELAKSLIKLQIQNLSTMDADWMYASYHFSHPILPERLGALGWYGHQDSMDGKREDSATPLKASDREL
ncbi:CAAX prenyl protease 1 [Physcia stellaris]|nr:CAAX prenyl protease 1 [Physcia stellaris]